MKRNKIKYFITTCLFLAPISLFAQKPVSKPKIDNIPAKTSSLYPSFKNRKQSPGKTIYYIDPEKGNDQNLGTSSAKAWKTFGPTNQFVFSAGDQLRIIAPGSFDQSLVLMANGSKSAPVTISFVPGRYDIFPKNPFKAKFHISNTNDTPDSLKAVALYFLNSKYVRVEASRAKMVLRGKMIEMCVDKTDDISFNGISFDYQRPTVSELTVMKTGTNFADLKIHPDSKYSIRDSILIWEGEGWQHQANWYWQVFNPEKGDLARQSMNLKDVKFSKNGDFVRASFPKNPGFQANFTYQNRDVTRDCAGIFMERSSNISFRNMRINFMHGMGIVSQFCTNISIDSLVVKPDEKSRRTCAAWADILHFSGCKGLIKVENSFLSAANDDAINIHGTHLKITQILSPNEIKVRFMHDQTYGFNAFTVGDSISYIHASSLATGGDNMVKKVKKLNDREFILTLQKAVPQYIANDYVIENASWTPNVLISNNMISTIPTRGILITTRRKAIIENCIFQNVHMSGILVADDAESWYESGMVNDLTIRKNKFELCGEPVINIHPENKVHEKAVHTNIRIINNFFDLKNTALLSAKSTSGILFKGNVIRAKTILPVSEYLKLENCEQMQQTDNQTSEQ